MCILPAAVRLNPGFPCTLVPSSDVDLCSSLGEFFIRLRFVSGVGCLRRWRRSLANKPLNRPIIIWFTRRGGGAVRRKRALAMKVTRVISLSGECRDRRRLNRRRLLYGSLGYIPLVWWEEMALKWMDVHLFSNPG